MNVGVGRPLAATRHPIVAQVLAALLPVGLLVASVTHFGVAIEHGVTTFAALSACAGIAQGLLAIVAVMHPSRTVYQLSMFSSLVFMQLYALNVTVGLPPLIAHTHDAHVHNLYGLTLAEPNPVDEEGMLAQGGQLVTVLSASFLDDQD